MDYLEKQIHKLVGYTVVGVATSQADEDDEWGNASYGMILRKGKSKKRIIAWIDSDEEGNGPGAIAIEEVKGEQA